MFIKRVAIEGFKSYKELQMAQELHPGSNLILGQNGCGKSNFLSAIIFALSDDFSSKTRQEKRQMLHEGEQRAQNRRANRDAQTFAVEVVLDNSKGKIPIDGSGPDVIIRKTYNCSTDKEDYYLNGKHVTARDLFNLFESGGFSLSHHSQFQVVQQGQIEQLVLRGEEGFLQMLKEVTGTQAFEEKVSKMQGVLGECETKKGLLQRTLEQVDERLKGLERDIEEFREVKKVENEKKALELILHLNRIEGNNMEAEKLRQEKRAKMEEREKILNQRERQLQMDSSMKENIEDIKDQIAQMEAKVLSLSKMRGELAALDVQNSALQSQRQEQKTLFAYFSTSYDSKMQSLERGIAALKVTVQAEEKRRQELAKEIEQLKQKQTELVLEKNILLMRQEASKKFTSENQRKKYAKEEQSKLQAQIASLQNDADLAKKSLGTTESKLSELEKRIKEKTEEAKKAEQEAKEVAKGQDETRLEKRKAAAEVKQLMVKQSEVDHEIKALKQKYQQEVEQLEKLEPSFITLRRLRSLLIERGIPGFKGFLLDFVRCGENLQACVDLAGKEKLFSLVVEDVETAKRVLEVNKEIKGGVINILPLSLVQAEKKRNYPESKECASLLSQLSFTDHGDPRLKTLLDNFFSKILLVKNYPLALEHAKQYHLTCITTDLQVVYSGAFVSKVGYYNRGQSDRVGAYSKVSTLQSKLELKVQERMSLEKEVDKASERDLEALRRAQKVDSQIANWKHLQQVSESLASELQRALSSKQKQTQELFTQREGCLQQVKLLQDQMQMIGKQIESGKAFSEEDQRRLLTINKALDELAKRLKGKEGEVFGIDEELAKNTFQLQEDEDRKQQWRQQIQKESEVSSGGQNEVEEVSSSQRQSVEEELASLRQGIAQKQGELALLLDTGSQSQSSEDIMKELRARTFEVEELSMRLDEVRQRNAELEAAAKRIDSFDKEVFERFKKVGREAELVKEIQEKAMQMESFPRMNRHCVDWFDKYSQKYKELQGKFNEQEQTEQGLKKLLGDIDTQKSHALERTFKRLNTHFEEIFQMIVPQGRAQLKLVKMPAQDESQLSHPSQLRGPESQILRLGNQLYKGMKVSVSFAGSELSDLEGGLAHLSGGQKSVVAAALLFAFLKVEAAPFYILDEFDNALDAEYRGAIAALIFELSKQSQFLITSFKPELVEGAEKVFEIGFRNGASVLDLVDKQRGYDILESLENER